MSDINASNLRLSRDMYQALFKDQKTRFLVESILGESGKVQLEAGAGESDDSDGLAKLRAHLEAVALKDDKQIDPDERALLDALDARNWRGTGEDVVQQNLVRIQALQQQVDKTQGDPTQVTFELQTQSFEERLEGSSTSHGVELKQTAVGAAAGAACSVEAGANECMVNSGEEFTRQSLISPTRQDHDKAVNQLKHEALNLGDSLAKVPHDKLRADLDRLGGCVAEDGAYVKQVLTSIGLDEAGLAAAGAPKEGAALADWLKSDKFAAWLDKNSPAALEKYRALLGQTLSAYREQPNAKNFAQLREIVYDHSYVFEAGEGSDAAAVAQYKQIKQTILAVSQQSQLLEKISSPENLPASLQELGAELSNSRETFGSDLLAAAGEVEKMLGQIEKQPALFAGADPSALRAALDKLVSRDAKGVLTLKDPKPSQAHLDAINSLWAEIEELGLKAGLGDEFSSQGAMNAALAVAAKAPGAEQDPARQILAKAPELAEYGDLLSKLSDPANKALLEAVMSNQPEAVSKFFTEYYGSFFDFKSMLGGLSGFGAGMALGGLGGGLIGGAIGVGLSYGLKLFGSKADGTASDAGSPAARFGFDLPTLNLPNLSTGLGFGSAKPEPGLKLGLPGQTPPGETGPSGRQMKLMGLSQADVETVMKLLAEKPEARALLQQHGSDLNQLIQQSPQREVLQGAIDAKQAFDAAFWSQSSRIEDAQASAQRSLSANTNARLSLTQAAQAVDSALTALPPDSPQRASFSQQKEQIAAALKALDSGATMPAGSPDLDRSLAAVRSANSQSGVTISEAVLSENQKYLNQKTLDPLLAELAAASSDGRLQALLDKLPAAEAASLKALLSDESGTRLDASAFSAELRQVLDSKYIAPGFARQLTGRVQTLLELVRQANAPGATAKTLAAFGNKVVDPKNIVPTTPFQLIDDMRLMQTSLRDIRDTLGDAGLDLAAQRFADAGRQMMSDMSQGSLPKTREAVRERIQQVVESVKHEGLNRSLIQGLQQPSQAAAPAGMSAAELSSVVKNNPVLQTSLKGVFDKVGASLKARSDLKPTLDKLAQTNTGAMSEIQTLLAKAGENPANLAGDLEALLSRHLDPAAAQKLQTAILSEMSSQLDSAISQAEKAKKDYSRSDTQKAQGALVDSLKAFKQVMLSSQEVQAVDRQIESAASETINHIGANASDLLIQQEILPKDKDALSLLKKFFPSLSTGQTSEAQLLSELTAFSSISRAEIEAKLGRPLKDEQFLSFKLAASSMAMSLSVRDRSRGPIAAALGRLTQDLIKHPELLKDPGKLAQIGKLLEAAGRLPAGADGVGARDALLGEIAALSPDAAATGRSQAKTLDSKAATDQRIQAFTGRSRGTQTPPTQGDPQTDPNPNTNPNVAAQTDPKTAPHQAAGSEPNTSPAATNTRPGNSRANSDPKAGQTDVGTLLTGFMSSYDIKLVMNDGSQPQPSTQAGADELVLNLNISGPPATPAQRDQTWQAGTQAVDEAIETYAKLPPARQQAYQQQPGIADFLAHWQKEQAHYAQTVSHHDTHRCELLDEWMQRVDIYNHMSKAFAQLLQSDPSILHEMIAKLTQNVEARANGSEIAAKLSRQADELAGKLLAPTADPKQLEKLNKDIEAFLRNLSGYNQQTQQLALVQLANKMITSAISAFYDQRTQLENKHHFARLAAMADKLRDTLDKQLEVSLAAQASSGQSAVASGSSGAELGEALNLALRSELDQMLATTQQMRPPMMTDFKRAQILQSLFDGDASNDLRGILALAGAKS